MLESHPMNLGKLTCDICGKTRSLIYKDLEELNLSGYLINTVTNDCICPKCLAKLKKNNKQAKSIEKSIVESNESTIYNIDTWLTTIKNDRNRDIITLRLRGNTLDVIGKIFGITRERIRQVCNKTLENTPILEEDSFEALYWFKNYEFLTEKELIDVFGISEQTFYYYKLKYDRNTTTTVDDLFNDSKLTEELYTKFDDIFIYSEAKKDDAWHSKALISYDYLFKNNPYGQLTLIDIVRKPSKNGHRKIKAVCKCSCGKYTTIPINRLKRTKSCGCLVKNPTWLAGTAPTKHPTKPVKCVETGEIFVSIKEAAMHIGVDSGSISNCCKNPEHSIRGYHWEYADPKYGRHTYEGANCKKVECIETGEIFPSVTAAKKKYPSVGNVLYNYVESTNGLHFKFVD